MDGLSFLMGFFAFPLAAVATVGAMALLHGVRALRKKRKAAENASKS